jgi:hypothetical protein
MKKLFTCLLLVSMLSTASAMTYYVDSMAMGGATGLSWQDAVTDLQAALALAMAGDTILVAQGTYKPGSDPATTFLIDKNLTLLGGYPSGGGSPDPVLYETILSGDLNGDDVAGNFLIKRADNVMTVVTLSGSISVLIAGLTISHGHADGFNLGAQNRGGGLYGVGLTSLALHQCKLLENYALKEGGVGFLSGADITAENCTIETNQANQGGGIFIESSFYELKNCDFKGNAVVTGSLFEASGGAVFIKSSSGAVKDCSFLENTSAEWGAGLEIWSPSNFNGMSSEVSACSFIKNTASKSAAGLNIVQAGGDGMHTVKNCIFQENTAALAAGAIGVDFKASAQFCLVAVDSCHFSQNTGVQFEGGGIGGYLRGTNLTFELSNSSFLDNQAGFGGGGVTLLDYGGSNGNASISHCTFEQNTTGQIGGGLSLGGWGNISYSVTDCTFHENEAEQYGGGIDIFSQAQKQVTVERCLFDGNVAGDIGAGIGIAVNNDGFTAVISRCELKNNSSPAGAAVGADPAYTESGGSAQGAGIRIENCLMTGNTSEAGAVAIRNTGHIELTNCTIAGNASGGIVLENQAVATLQNNILFNAETEYQDLSGDVVLFSNGGNLVRDGSLGGLNPEDHENEDPLFVGTGDGCTFFQLSAGSPAVDEGIELENGPDQDLCENMRVQGNRIDIGAMESPFTSSVRDAAPLTLSFSPNPAADLLNIEWPETMYGPVELSIYDAHGRLLAHQAQFSGKAVDVKKLPSGLFFLQAVWEGNIYQVKFQKN